MATDPWEITAEDITVTGATHSAGVIRDRLRTRVEAAHAAEVAKLREALEKADSILDCQINAAAGACDFPWCVCVPDFRAALASTNPEKADD